MNDRSSVPPIVDEHSSILFTLHYTTSTSDHIVSGMLGEQSSKNVSFQVTARKNSIYIVRRRCKRIRVAGITEISPSYVSRHIHLDCIQHVGKVLYRHR
jgi:hypothetical protein